MKPPSPACAPASFSEELFHAGEEVHEKRLRRSTATPWAADLALLRRQCAGLSAAAGARETARTLSLLGQAVPEFARQTALPAKDAGDAAESGR